MTLKRERLREFTPSSFDRSIEPSFGASYEISAPNIWRDPTKKWS